MGLSSLACRYARCAAILILLPGVCAADDDATPEAVPASTLASGWDKAQQEFGSIWRSDQADLYLPLNIWHNRAFYSSAKIASYNEQPWGLGFGRHRYDAAGNWHALYAMAFLESHNDVEPVAGYAFQKIWRPTAGLRLGAGFTAGVTLRAASHYVPIPVLLPLASVESGRLALQFTYIPGGNGKGNVLFTWLRWQL
jgi:lipid IVA palmitoyltransferase